MKKLTTKLMISVLSVALAFIALGTSTFAWFSMNTTVEASGMQLTAVTPINLLINDDNNSTFANKATADENFGTGKLYPASTNPNVAYSNLVFNAIINSGNYINNGQGGVADPTTTFQKSSNQSLGDGETKPAMLVNDANNAADGYWAVYTYQLKLSEKQTSAADVYLSSLNIYAQVKVAQYEVDSEHVTNYYTESAGVYTQLTAAAATESHNDKNYLPAGTYFTKGGIAAAARVALYVGAVTGSTDAETYKATYANADDSAEAIVGTIGTYGKKYSELANADKATVNAIAPVDNASYYFKVNDEAVKVRLVVWVEGQDTDCDNAVAGQNFRIDLGFSVHTN